MFSAAPRTGASGRALIGAVRGPPHRLSGDDGHWCDRIQSGQSVDRLLRDGRGQLVVVAGGRRAALLRRWDELGHTLHGPVRRPGVLRSARRSRQRQSSDRRDQRRLVRLDQRRRCMDCPALRADPGDAFGSGEILAACPDGIWRSADGGTTWTGVALPGSPGSFTRIAVSIAPSDPSVAYAWGASCRSYEGCSSGSEV